MEVSSAGNSIASLQLLQSLLANPTQTSVSDLEELFSDSLSSAQQSTASGTATDTSTDTTTSGAEKTSSFSMLQALLNYNTINPLIAMLNGSTSSSTDSSGIESLFGSTGTSSYSDSLLQAATGSGSSDDLFSMLENLQSGSSDDSSTDDSLFNSNFALLRALGNSGMSSTQMMQIVNQVQTGSTSI